MTISLAEKLQFSKGYRQRSWYLQKNTGKLKQWFKWPHGWGPTKVCKRLGHFSHEKGLTELGLSSLEEAQEDLINVWKYLKEGCKRRQRETLSSDAQWQDQRQWAQTGNCFFLIYPNLFYKAITLFKTCFFCLLTFSVSSHFWLDSSSVSVSCFIIYLRYTSSLGANVFMLKVNLPLLPLMK